MLELKTEPGHSGFGMSLAFVGIGANGLARIGTEFDLQGSYE